MMGIPFGAGLRVFGDLYTGENPVYIIGDLDGGSELACPPEQDHGCVVRTDAESVHPPYYLGFQDHQCTRCVGINEPIAMTYVTPELPGIRRKATYDEPVGEGSEEYERKLQVCKGDGAVEYVDLINNSISDTIAAYRSDGENREALITCRERGGIYTAIGCVDPTPIGILTGLIRVAFGVTGGVALIQLIMAGIAYQSGQEEKIQEAKKRVFATIGGLAVLVFSVLILRIIGVNVLDVLPIGSI